MVDSIGARVGARAVKKQVEKIHAKQLNLENNIGLHKQQSYIKKQGYF